MERKIYEGNINNIFGFQSEGYWTLILAFEQAKTMAKVICVFSATGQLGSSLVKHLSRDFHIRALVADDTNGAKTEELRACPNVSVVQIIHCNAKSLDDALDGADACFVITTSDMTSHDSYNKEVQQGKAIADACKRAAIKHVVYSSQRKVVQVLGINAKHMDAKGEVENYMNQQRLPLTTVVLPCFYQSLLTPPFRPSRVQNDFYEIEIPMGQKSLNIISCDDVGPAMVPVFSSPQEYISKTLHLSGDIITIKEMAATLTKHLHPTTFRDKQITVSQFSKKPFSGAPDIANMFDFLCRVDQQFSVDRTKKLNPHIQSFDMWVSLNKGQLLKALDYPPPPSPDPWGSI